MASITYTGPEPTTWGGVTFEPGKPVDVTEKWMLDKARGNPFFDVSGDDSEEPAEGEAPARRRGRPPRSSYAEPAPAADQDD